jgi:D-aspartate ligase
MNINTLPHASDLQGPLRRDVGALILGGAHGSLAIARSLGRRGVPVFAASDHPLVRLSRYVTRVLPWDVCGADPLPRLLDLARREQLDGLVVFAGGDAEVRFLAQNHATLSAIFRLTTPPWEVVKWSYDKHLVRQHAEAVGVATPVSYSARNRDEVERLDCRFPVVLKPSVRDSVNAFTQAKAWRADDRATLLARWDQAAALVGDDAVVVQELIPGEGTTQFSHAAIWDRGRPVVSLVAQRLRQYPIEFGYTSTYVETADCPQVAEASRRFLGPLGFTGIAEIEFKFDRRDDRYKILDVNARAWTWTALGFAAGIDFPYALWRLATGEAVEPIVASEAAWMHASRDAVAAAQLMLAGRLSPREYLRSLKTPLAFAAFAADDPIPGIAELPLALARTITRRLPVAARELVGTWRRRMG